MYSVKFCGSSVTLLLGRTVARASAKLCHNSQYNMLKEVEKNVQPTVEALENELFLMVWLKRTHPTFARGQY